MTATVAMVVNPGAGDGRGESAARTARERLTRRGARVRVRIGRSVAECAGHIVEALREKPDALTVVGGDGIVHLALQSLATTAVPLAVIPTGTGNDFARTVGIPRGDPDSAADAILDGNVATIDLGRAGGRWFATVLTGGFDSLVARRRNRMRWPRGRTRYTLAILAELARLRPRHYELEIDGRRLDTEAAFVSVGNGPSYGGGMRICPHAEPDDGLLAVTVVGPVTRRTLLRVFPEVFAGSHIHRPEVRTYHARGVRIGAAGIPAYADGEFAATLPLTVEVVPRALRVVRPGG